MNMIRKLRNIVIWLLFAFVLLFVILFMLVDRGNTTINLSPLPWQFNLSLNNSLFIAFLFGLFIGFVILVLYGIKLKYTIWILKKKLKNLQTKQKQDINTSQENNISNT